MLHKIDERPHDAPDAPTTSGGVQGECEIIGSTDVRHQTEDLYHAFARELWARLYGLCGDAERAHDGVQEAFLRLQSYGPENVRHPRIWLFHVGRNWLRDLSRRRAGDEVTATTAHDFLTSAERSPADAAVHSEMRQDIRKALLQLKLADREVLVLRYGLGWSSSRIALSLDSQPSAIDMRLSRARGRLAARLRLDRVDWKVPAQDESPPSVPGVAAKAMVMV